MIIHKRGVMKEYQFQGMSIIEWTRRINGMEYEFVAWCKRNNGNLKASHIFVYPKWGNRRLFTF